jgi:NAD(P)-dependent dehydrogenase (short-subunit alcohol dehydrogenase family)
MKVDLKGKIALVTGAGKGIGRAIAETFTENGAHVAYTDVDEALLRENPLKGDNDSFYELDVRNDNHIEETISKIIKECGPIDILVNNAGGGDPNQRVTGDRLPDKSWAMAVDMNLNSPFKISKKVLSDSMIPQKSGRIINIASVAGIVPLQLQCAYDASKAGLIQLTKALAVEMGVHGITINAIAPGSTLTDGTRKIFYSEDGSFSEHVQRHLDHVPLGRPAQPEEIAHAVLFLAAPESAYITGQVLAVDGGWTAGFIRDF